MKLGKNSKQVLWFATIWTASVATLFLIAQLIRWAMPD